MEGNKKQQSQKGNTSNNQQKPPDEEEYDEEYYYEEYSVPTSAILTGRKNGKDFEESNEDIIKNLERDFQESKAAKQLKRRNK